MGGCYSRGPAGEVHHQYNRFVDFFVYPKIPYTEMPRHAYNKFMGMFQYGIGEENPWRAEEEAANTRDVFQSSSLPELADNITSLIDHRKKWAGEMAESFKNSPGVARVAATAGVAQRRLSTGVDAAFSLVVSRAEKKKPPTAPPPKPKKGLDGRFVEKEIRHRTCPTCQRTPAMCVCDDEYEDGDADLRRGFQNRLRPDEAADKAALDKHNREWGKGIRPKEPGSMLKESLSKARERRASMDDAASRGVGRHSPIPAVLNSRRASIGGLVSEISPAGSPMGVVGSPGAGVKKDLNVLAEQHKKKMFYVRPTVR